MKVYECEMPKSPEVVLSFQNEILLYIELCPSADDEIPDMATAELSKKIEEFKFLFWFHPF